MNSITTLCRVFAALLKLYPQSYRQKYTAERQEVFQLAAEEAAMSGKLNFFFFSIHEIVDLPITAFIEHFHERRWLMFSNFWLSLSEKPGRWGTAILAGIPHLLFVLCITLPTLLDSKNPFIQWYSWITHFPPTNWMLTFLAPQSYWNPFRVGYQVFQWLFGLLVILMILVAMLRKWPIWSATWIGFGFVTCLRNIITKFPDGVEALVTMGIWLVLLLIVMFFLARRSPLMGLLVFLPVYPLFYWWLAIDGIAGVYPEIYAYIAAAALLSVAVMLITRLGSFKLAILFLVILVLAVGGGFEYANVYYSNMPNPEEPNFSRVVTATLGGLLTLLIIGLPVWMMSLWKARKSRLLKS